MLHPDYQFQALPIAQAHQACANNVSTTLLTLIQAKGMQSSHLHENELAVLARRKQPKAQQEYLVSRWCIKELVKILKPEYASLPHNQLETRFNEQVKQLQVYANNDLLDINVVISHSHQHVGVAATLNAQTVLGLDIEKIDEKRPFQKLAAHFYPKQEATEIGDNVDIFFRVWTLKEAYAKAAKQSISTLLSQPILPLLENIHAQVLCEQWQQFDVSLITATERVQFIDLAPTTVGESL